MRVHLQHYQDLKREKMKKLILSIPILIVSLFVAGCEMKTETKITEQEGENKLDIYELTMEEAKKINANSNLGLEFLAYSDITAEQAKQYGNDHPETIEIEDGKVKGYYFNYPFDSEDRRLTQIAITDEGYDFYGMAVGDDILSVDDKMEAAGYQLIDNLFADKNTSAATYLNNHICVIFETKKDSTDIISILVTLYDQDEPEVVY